MPEKLLLLHGALGSEMQFHALKEELSGAFEVHSMNFEGHGGLASSNDFSIALFTQNVIDFLDENEISEINIFGYSMGGYVALNTAMKIPNKINKIITLGTKFNWDPQSAEKEVNMLNPDIIAEKVPQFAETLKQAHDPQDWKEVMNKTARMMIGMSKGARLEDADLRRLSHRVIIGVGTLDNMVSHAESAYVADLIPHATLVSLEGVKHPIEKVDMQVLLDYIISI